MGDNLCGPSNPLQAIQKQTSADRSLQQDRLASRQHPQQGFRSDSSRTAGALDQEFEAFQAGPSTAHFGPASFAQQNRPLRPLAPSFYPASQTSNWAADFQRLHISPSNHLSGPGALQAHPQQHNAQLQNTANWHVDFQRQHMQQPSSYHPMQFRGGHGFQQMPMGAQSAAGPTNLPPQQALSREMEEAFEREFEAHEAEILRMEQAAQKEPRELTEAEWIAAVVDEDSVEDALRHREEHVKGPSMTNNEEIGLAATAETRQMHVDGEFAEPVYFPAQDTMDEIGGPMQETLEEAAEVAQSEPIHHQPVPDDDLSRTAAELISRVSDNQSEKFRKSQFMSLMNALANKQVRVQGDDLVDSNGVVADSTTLIPPSEQDDDPGRDPQMAGALDPSDSTRVSEVQAKGKQRRTSLFTHLVDDF